MIIFFAINHYIIISVLKNKKIICLSQSAVQAIFAVSKFEDIVDDVSKINALSKFMEDPKGNDFLSILKRVRRILSIEEKKDNILITLNFLKIILQL